MAEGITVQTVNVDLLAQALREAPDLSFKFIRERMQRFGGTFRNRFIRKRLSGGDGIQWGSAKVGGHVRTKLSGQRLLNLKLTVSLSRLLRAHELGVTITPRTAGGRLVLQSPRGTVIATAASVTLPARLGFRALWREEVKKEVPRLERALQRALREAMRQRMKSIASITQAIRAA